MELLAESARTRNKYREYEALVVKLEKVKMKIMNRDQEINASIRALHAEFMNVFENSNVDIIEAVFIELIVIYRNVNESKTILSLPLL
jgi:hypothetical protein